MIWGCEDESATLPGRIVLRCSPASRASLRSGPGGRPSGPPLTPAPHRRDPRRRRNGHPHRSRRDHAHFTWRVTPQWRWTVVILRSRSWDLTGFGWWRGQRPSVVSGRLEPHDVAGEQRAECVRVDRHHLPEPDAETVRGGGRRGARLGRRRSPLRSSEQPGDPSRDLAAELVDLLLEVEKQAGEVDGRLGQVLGPRLVAQVLRQLQGDA